MSHVSHSETTRLEAFSDGVLAIILTIMVLELHVPHEPTLAALSELMPVFFGYVLSFVYIAIYWNNHHHLLHATKGISAGVMWANMHLLFWLSLIPFCTAFVGESHGKALPAVVYGVVLLMAACAYTIFQSAIIRNQGRDSDLAKALSDDFKGKTSLVLYALGILIAFWHPLVSYAFFATVALLWIVPDRRLAPMFDHSRDGH